MSIAIFTADETTLTINTQEPLHLEQMGHEADPIELQAGANSVLVGAGVYRVLSDTPVQVTGETSEFVVTPMNKDGGGSPDTPKFTVGLDPAAVRDFITAAMGESAPE